MGDRHAAFGLDAPEKKKKKKNDPSSATFDRRLKSFAATQLCSFYACTEYRWEVFYLLARQGARHLKKGYMGTRSRLTTLHERRL